MVKFPVRFIFLFDFIKSYFGNPFYGYWHCPHPIDKRCLDDKFFLGYYIDFTYKANYPFSFDQNGIPLLPLSTQHWATSVDCVYNPIVICQWGLGNFSVWLSTNDTSCLHRAMNAAHWICENIRYENEYGFLEFDYFDFNGPVRSGMANGLAISFLIRLDNFVPGNNFKEIIKSLVLGLTMPIEFGGIFSRHHNSCVFEEYNSEPHAILNGHIFSFIGIIDYCRSSHYNENVISADFINLVTNSTFELSTRSNCKFWSLYSQRGGIIPNISSRFYHLLHINLLNILYFLTSDGRYLIISKKFQDFDRRFTFRFLAMIAKLFDKFISISSNVATRR